MLARHLTDEKGRNLRGIRKWLIVDPRQLRNNIHRLLGRDVEFGVVGSKMLRHSFGVWRLVVCVFFESNGEGPHLLGALRLHKRHDHR